MSLAGERVVVALKSDSLRQKVKESLARGGYNVVGEAGEGMAALRLIHGIQPDVLLADLQLPGVDGLELAKVCEEERLAPVILAVDYPQLGLLNNAMETWVFEVLVKPFTEIALLSSIHMARNQFMRHQKMEEEVRELKETLLTRKVVDKAKGLLMDVKGLKEADAHKFIHRLAMDNRIPLRKAAEAITKKLAEGK